MRSFAAAIVVTLLAFWGGAVYGAKAVTPVQAATNHTWIFHHAQDQNDMTEFINSLEPDQRVSAKIVPFSTAGYSIWFESR